MYSQAVYSIHTILLLQSDHKLRASLHLRAGRDPCQVFISFREEERPAQTHSHIVTYTYFAPERIYDKGRIFIKMQKWDKLKAKIERQARVGTYGPGNYLKNKKSSLWNSLHSANPKPCIGSELSSSQREKGKTQKFSWEAFLLPSIPPLLGTAFGCTWYTAQSLQSGFRSGIDWSSWSSWSLANSQLKKETETIVI